jgi:hypothetical protein
MKVEFVLLAEGINKTASGTINVLGEFNTLYSEEFPFVRPSMAFWVRVQVDPTDKATHKIRGELVRKGTDLKLVEFETPAAPSTSTSPGDHTRGDIVVSAYGLVFPESGEYSVNVYIDETLAGTKPLFVWPTPVSNR